jgi:hypothetical protein
MSHWRNDDRSSACDQQISATANATCASGKIRSFIYQRIGWAAMQSSPRGA